jgi:dGTPase
MGQGYGPEDHERFVPEPGYTGRSDFARDRARVLHSSALRRLAAKTQVLMAGQDDFPRTRLTHTLEVAQISRELGASLGADPDVVDTAGLAHDLGHPPFGHNGESTLDELSRAIGGFEGNAQSLRVLTRLEFKIFDGDRSVGLNLTRATLDSMIKYPWARRPGTGKFNVYDDDRDVFDWVRAASESDRRCFEAQIMDWADDVAYCVHDLEDAIVSGSFDPAALKHDTVRADVVAEARKQYAPAMSEAQLDAALSAVMAQEYWPREFEESARGLAGLKTMTSSLIRRYCRQAQAATRERYGTAPLTRYRADLEIPEQSRAEVAVLKAITFVHVMRGNDRRYVWERAVIQDVVAGLLEGRGSLQRPFQNAWDHTEDPQRRLRLVVDQVASLTDLSIVRWREQLAGH